MNPKPHPALTADVMPGFLRQHHEDHALPAQRAPQRKLSYEDSQATFSLSSLPAGLRAAGSVNGYSNLENVLLDGAQAARQAAGGLDSAAAITGGFVAEAQVNFPWPIFAHPKGKEFVDFDEDLQIRDIINATRHGYRNVQLVKRFSTVGMGPSQGRHSALPTARSCASSARPP